MMPVESKVKASTAAAALSGLLLWILGRYAFRGDVPDVVASWVYAVVPAALAFAAGWAAKHTARAGDPPPAVPAVPAAAIVVAPEALGSGHVVPNPDPPVVPPAA